MSILKVARMGHPVLRQRGRLLEKNDLIVLARPGTENGAAGAVEWVELDR